MNIQLREIIIRDLVAGYQGDGDDGKTIEENCQMLCKKCNREKSAK